ncbi:MAG: HEAT repeat domain-containing protein [Bryobacteraceae bacterium]
MHRRCLAARANGLLGKHGPSWLAEGVDDDDSPLGRARRHGTSDAERRRDAERRFREKEEATGKMRQLGVESVSEVIGILRDRSQSPERRGEAAAVLAGLKCRDAVGPLIEVLAEGHPNLSWMCMSALTKTGSRRFARSLIDMARGSYPLPARQEAIYTLWQLKELRAEPLFIRLSAALDTEEDYTRGIATEALGNTWWRPRTQRAISARLSDPSVSVRFSALCAVRRVNIHTLDSLRRALVAKLADPAKVDDNRVVATLAAQLLSRA